MLTIKQYLSPPFKARVRRVGQLALLAGLFEISRLSRFESGTFAQFGSVQALALYVADALSVISDVALVLAGALILGAVQSRTEFTGEGRRTELHPGVLAGRSPAWLAAAIVALSVASRGLLWEHYAYIGLAQCALAAVKLSAIVLLCAVLLNAAPGQLLRAASRWWPLALTLFAYLQLFFHPLPMAALNRATVAVVRLLLVSLEGASALSMHEVANGTWIRLGGFEVDILPVCSGYEGLFLFSGLYLSYALIARCRPGLMMVVIWLAGLVGVFSLNAVRIVGLLELGARLAPQGAIYGFHSRFGILAVLAVACCAVLALERVAPRTKTPEGSQTGKLPSVIHLRDLTQDRANLRSGSDGGIAGLHAAGGDGRAQFGSRYLSCRYQLALSFGDRLHPGRAVANTPRGVASG